MKSGENTLEGSFFGGKGFTIGGMTIEGRLFKEYHRGMRAGILLTWVIMAGIFVALL